MRKCNRNNLRFFLLLMITLAFTACKEGGSAKDAVDGAMKALVAQDYKTYASSIYVDGYDKENVDNIIALFVYNLKEQYEKNPVVDYEILKEEAKEEDAAVVEVKFKQKDGKETATKMIMVKNKDGEWKIEGIKDSETKTPATEEKIEEEIVEETADESKEDPNTYTVNGESFTMVAVEGGTFSMGLTPEQTYHDEDTKPAHDVTLSDFYIGKTEVTQSLWIAVMGNIPSNILNQTTAHPIGDNIPVYYVSWNDCQAFINRLNAMTEGQRPTGHDFRLPTEAEWEYAARGGNKSNHTEYAGSSNRSSVASSGQKPVPVASKIPNELGIYDMSGNVWEWCQDWYAPDYYSRSPSTNPCNNTTSSSRYGRVIRGAGTVAYRTDAEPEYGRPWIGIRLAL